MITMTRVWFATFLATNRSFYCVMDVRSPATWLALD
jgi:hypothetical protein